MGNFFYWSNSDLKNLEAAAHRDGYRLPTNFYMRRSEVTADLYQQEEVRDEAVKAAATEWQKLRKGIAWVKLDGDDQEVGPRSADFYKEALPQQLFDLLGSFDRKAALVAAIEFIRTYRPAE